MSAKDAGGMTHIRYGHRCRPTALDVVCPRCGGLAHARHLHEAAPLMGDMSRDFGEDAPCWAIRCTACFAQSSDVAYQDLPPLYWRVSRRGLDLWAWNRAHVGLLIHALEGTVADDEPYAFLAAYVPGRWKAQAPAATKLLRRLLARGGPS